MGVPEHADKAIVGSAVVPEHLLAHSKIEKVPLADQVYAVIWEQIVGHKLWPGDKLSDLRISEELEVSRTPVREALFRLAQDGIVQTRSHRGFFVARFSKQDVSEIYDIRTALEVLATRLALPLLTDVQLDEAQQAFDQAHRQLDQGAEGARQLWLLVDRSFHTMLVQASGNLRLEAMLAGLQAQIGVFQVYGTHVLQVQQLALAHHCKILSALNRRDTSAAELAMERHIQEMKAHMVTEFNTLIVQPE